MSLKVKCDLREGNETQASCRKSTGTVATIHGFRISCGSHRSLARFPDTVVFPWFSGLADEEFWTR